MKSKQKAGQRGIPNHYLTHMPDTNNQSKETNKTTRKLYIIF